MTSKFSLGATSSHRTMTLDEMRDPSSPGNVARAMEASMERATRLGYHMSNAARRTH